MEGRCAEAERRLRALERDLADKTEKCEVSRPAFQQCRFLFVLFVCLFCARCSHAVMTALSVMFFEFALLRVVLILLLLLLFVSWMLSWRVLASGVLFCRVFSSRVLPCSCFSASFSRSIPAPQVTLVFVSHDQELEEAMETLQSEMKELIAEVPCLLPSYLPTYLTFLPTLSLTYSLSDHPSHSHLLSRHQINPPSGRPSSSLHQARPQQTHFRTPMDIFTATHSNLSIADAEEAQARCGADREDAARRWKAKTRRLQSSPPRSQRRTAG